MADSPVLLRAREALRLADAEPHRAAALAEDVTADAARRGDRVAQAVAQRAWGLAVRQHGDLDAAIQHLSAAIRLGSACGARTVAGEARMTLAFALAERGRPRRAVIEINTALTELDGVARARALMQRGTILMELGRYDEAIESYRGALPVLRAGDDRLSVYRVMANRGLAHAYRHEFAGAESDLREAERLAGELQLPLSVGFAQANLAFVLALRGNVPAALDYSKRAEQRIRAHEAQVGELLKDRSELLLSVRLVAEARETAEQAVAAYEKERRGFRLPEVRLVLAQAALLDGDLDGARAQARRAAAEFARQDRPAWAATARLVDLRAQSVGGRLSPSCLRTAEEAVATLVAAGRPAAAVEARLLAAALLRRRGRNDDAARHLREAARARDRGPALLSARGWYAEAVLRAASGRRRAARSAVVAGLRVLDEHRAALGATDLRAHAAGHRTDLAELGLRLALEDRTPRRVLEWAERSRATDLLHVRSPSPPEEPAVAQALAELRSTVLRISEARAGGAEGEAARLLQRQTQLEREVRDHFRRQPVPGGSFVGSTSAAALIDELGDAALLELIAVDDDLLAVTLVAGRARLHRIGSAREGADLVTRITFALRRLLRPEADSPGRDAARSLLRSSAASVDALLLSPLAELGDRQLVVVPTGALQCLPWAVLPSCAGRAVTVVPSASLWHLTRTRPAERSGPVLVAAGPHLPGAVAEVRAVADVHDLPALVPPHATVEAVLSGMEGAAVVHLAAHGRVETHNPLFSHLLLCDGPLLAHDVERLRRPPHTVVLAACDSGRAVVCPGDELLGLSTTFLAAGTTQLVAAVLPILDAETPQVMADLHRRLAAGTPVSEAVASAQLDARGSGDAVEAAAACFVSMGAGIPIPRCPPDSRTDRPSPVPTDAATPDLG